MGLGSPLFLVILTAEIPGGLEGLQKSQKKGPEKPALK